MERERPWTHVAAGRGGRGHVAAEALHAQSPQGQSPQGASTRSPAHALLARAFKAKDAPDLREARSAAVQPALSAASSGAASRHRSSLRELSSYVQACRPSRCPHVPMSPPPPSHTTLSRNVRDTHTHMGAGSCSALGDSISECRGGGNGRGGQRKGGGGEEAGAGHAATTANEDTRTHGHTATTPNTCLHTRLPAQQ
jgi:hypothetical protein